MKYNLYFFIIVYFLIAVIPSHGMEQKNKLDLNSAQEVTGVKNARKIRYTRNHGIAVSSYNECRLINPKTKESRCIDYEMDFCRSKKTLALESIDNKIILLNGRGIMTYDMQARAKGWSEERRDIRSISINAANNTIFACYAKYKHSGRDGIAIYNYILDKFTTISMPDKACALVATHPTKDIICIAHYLSEISLCKLDNLSENNLPQAIKKIETIFLVPFKQTSFCQYNPDGSYLVAGNDEVISIIEPQAMGSDLTSPQGERFKGIAFHPNGLVLATLSDRSVSSLQSVGVVHYWDLKTRQIFYSTPELPFGKAHDLSFSNDGLEIAVALEDKCIRTLVPFAVKEKCSYFFLVLQRKLPKCLAKHCIDIFLQNLCF